MVPGAGGRKYHRPRRKVDRRRNARPNFLMGAIVGILNAIVEDEKIQMTGAEALIKAAEKADNTLLREYGDNRDPAGSGPRLGGRHKGRALRFRGRLHGCSRRVRPHDRAARHGPAPPRPGSCQRNGQPPQREKGTHAACQRYRRARILAPAERPAPGDGYRKSRRGGIGPCPDEPPRGGVARTTIFRTQSARPCGTCLRDIGAERPTEAGGDLQRARASGKPLRSGLAGCRRAGGPAPLLPERRR